MLPNPFELPGPSFLVFYLLLSVAVAIAIVILRRLTERGEVPSELGFDPYQIAYLRGGRDEATHVAALSLLDRGLIVAAGTQLKVVDASAVRKVRRTLDRAILQRLAEPASAAELYGTGEVQRAADMLGDSLRNLGLLPGQQTRTVRVLLFLGGLAVMWGVFVVRLGRWVEHGRAHPIGFLIVLTLAAPFVLSVATFPRKTVLGSWALKQLGQMFSGLRARRDNLAANGATNEVALLAAIFGFSALPLAMAAHARSTARPRPASSGCGSGTSCSGSSCSGGSGSCGGGGGCGGCG
jgi:uncharacterized protein (TIGR04222 family)